MKGTVIMEKQISEILIKVTNIIQVKIKTIQALLIRIEEIINKTEWKCVRNGPEWQFLYLKKKCTNMIFS